MLDHEFFLNLFQILESKPNGLWSTRFPVEYKERFQEDPPGNLLELVKAWKDLSRVEFNTLTNTEVFYPVKETTPPPIQAIPSPKKDVPVLTQIPFPVQHSSQSLKKDLTKGKFVAAMYSTDGSWSRAEILSDSPENVCTSILRDDGICEVDLYLKEDSEISINQKLIELGLVRPLEEIVIEDSISEAGSDIEPEQLKLPEENEWDVYISFINQSSNSVVLRLEKLDEFDNELEKSYQTCSTVCSVEVDGLYIALIDELYHRVRVLSIMDDTMIEVYFLDHGDTEKVNKDQLKTLDPAVNKLLPYQAIEVSLYGLEK
ncbi:TDRD1_4_6_7 [Mytilus edulis]|uniref:TDRD1_4_6_7 n=1 Tax=Mytilus edulis TaxID=6550 RepID=A0A8S3S4Y7_MYTED|nr:TDRD1_4_6_7 [Mytilus edulis]